jgi:hypothetical protein
MLRGVRDTTVCLLCNPETIAMNWIFWWGEHYEEQAEMVWICRGRSPDW